MNKLNLFLRFKQNIRFPTSRFLFLTFAVITGCLILATIFYRNINFTERMSWSYASVSGGQLPRELIQEEMFDKLEKNPGDENIIRGIFVAQKGYVSAERQNDDTKMFNDPDMLKSIVQKVLDISELPDETIQAWFKYEIFGAGTALEYLVNTKWSEKNPLQTGIILFEEKRFNEALVFLERAIQLAPNSKDVKIYYFYTHLELGGKKLELLLQDKSFSSIIDHKLLASYFIKKGEYLKMIPHLVMGEIRNYSISSVIVSLVTGLGWLIFILQMGYIGYWPLKFKLLSLLAIILGAASAFVTLIFVTIQNHALGFDVATNYTFIKVLAYYIAGVGLREELLKLIFFIPIALILRKRNEQLLILSLASLVGLGFAIEENIYYYTEFSGFPVVSRFLTANFFHMAMTGYCGYYLVRAMQKKGEAWVDFVIQTLFMIFIHGLYDFLLSSDTNGVLGFFAMAGFIIVTRKYLHVFLALNPGISYTISLPFIFICALSITIGMGYFLITDHLVFVSASLLLLVNSLSGVFFIVYMFFHEMRPFIVSRKPKANSN